MRRSMRVLNESISEAISCDRQRGRRRHLEFLFFLVLAEDIILISSSNVKTWGTRRNDGLTEEQVSDMVSFRREEAKREIRKRRRKTGC